MIEKTHTSRSFLLTMLIFTVALLLIPAGSEAAAPQIQANKQYFDFAKRLYALEGNVVIVHQSRRLTTEKATTNMVEVWAEGGITFQQDDMKLSGNSGYANFLKNIVQITGLITFERNELLVTAEKVEFNWDTKLAVFTGDVKVKRGEETLAYETITYNVVNNEFQQNGDVR